MKKENESIQVTLEDTPINNLNKIMDKVLIGLTIVSVLSIVAIKLIVW